MMPDDGHYHVTFIFPGCSPEVLERAIEWDCLMLDTLYLYHLIW